MCKTSCYYLFALCLALFCLASVPLARADGGMIPWPPQVSLREAGQKAIIAWNGTEEALILSTDVRSSESATVLQFVPLPSRIRFVSSRKTKKREVRASWEFFIRSKRNLKIFNEKIGFIQKDKQAKLDEILRNY